MAQVVMCTGVNVGDPCLDVALWPPPPPESAWRLASPARLSQPVVQALARELGHR
jgi:hypothetical protein